MEKELLDWLKKSVGKTYSSPRKKVFGRHDAQDFKMIKIDEKKEQVLIHFVESKWPGLPLVFLMFDRALDFVRGKQGGWARLGTGFRPIDIDTIEAQIWKHPFPIGNSTYKTASHICDILVLAGLVEYGYITKLTNRRVQAVRKV